MELSYLDRHSNVFSMVSQTAKSPRYGGYFSRSRGERRNAVGRRPSAVASGQSVEEARRTAKVRRADGSHRADRGSTDHSPDPGALTALGARAGRASAFLRS